MNIKEEGKYYASLVRKYRTEYKSKNLQGFCRDQKVSYNKMLHCLRFARLMSVFANIRNYKLDPVKYLCDVFRRITNTADDKLVGLLAHKWQPATVSEWV